MNHWDLKPGETVTLAPVKRNGQVSEHSHVKATFMARTTLAARFIVGEEPRWYNLKEEDDGDLYREGYRWRIVTPRADTRTTLREDRPQRKPSDQPGVNPKNKNWRRLLGLPLESDLVPHHANQQEEEDQADY